MSEKNNKGLTNSELNLSKFEPKPEYNTEDNMIIPDFYSPCLALSARYERAVGYFRANIYRELGEDLLNFAKHGGKILLVCSPDIPEHDEEAAREGYELRGKRSEQEQEITLLYVLRDMSKDPKEYDCLNMLRLLIEKGSMELYIATRSGGIYHRKMGVFYDSAGNYIAFSGSGNETRRAVGSIEDWGNDEEFDVYRSWGNDFEAHKAETKARYFKKLITGGTIHTKVRPINEIEREELAKFRSHLTLEDCRAGARARSPSHNQSEEKLRPSYEVEIDGRKLSPYYYQIQAIEAWGKNNCVGMLSMATGTGKTYTALFAVLDLIKQGRLVVIFVPSKILLQQWYDIVSKFFPEVPILAAGGGHNWKAYAMKRIFVSDIAKPRIIISTMATASSEDFIEFLSQAKNPILIVDEAHRIGSPVFRKVLDRISFKERLGLSATPERLFDNEGNLVIQSTFGDIPVYNLPIDGKVKLSEEDDEEIPILGKFLTKYDYYYEIVNLNEEELEQWGKITAEIKKYIANNPSVLDSKGASKEVEKLELLYIKRARILKKAQGKVECACKTISERYQPESRWLIYCEDEEQMNSVAEAIREKHDNLPVLIYHSKMREAEKERTIQYFERHPSVIVSIRCLDEGIDIPIVDGALILASSTNPRQYIQRRGRVLRKAKGKRKATIVDVLVLPKKKDENVLMPVIKSELSRAWNFAKNANNAEITHELWKIGNIYGADLITDNEIALSEEILED